MADSTKCEVCQAELFQGQEIMIKNLELLQISGLVCREIRANCAVCGHEFIYSVSDKQIKKLINDVNKINNIGKGGLLDKDDQKLENSEVKK